MSTKTKALLKAEIDSKVTENGSNQITGEKLNDVLNDMVDSLCDGTNFDEGSIPDAALENPVSVSQNTQTGKSLANIRVGNVDYLIKAEQKDDFPMENSVHPVTSGGVSLNINGGNKRIDIDISGGSGWQYDLWSVIIPWDDDMPRKIYGVGDVTSGVSMFYSYSTNPPSGSSTGHSTSGQSGTVANPVEFNIPTGTQSIRLYFYSAQHTIGEDWGCYYNIPIEGIQPQINQLKYYKIFGELPSTITNQYVDAGVSVGSAVIIYNNEDFRLKSYDIGSYIGQTLMLRGTQTSSDYRYTKNVIVDANNIILSIIPPITSDTEIIIPNNSSKLLISCLVRDTNTTTASTVEVLQFNTTEVMGKISSLEENVSSLEVDFDLQYKLPEAPISVIRKDAGMCKIFKKWGFIGDSLSSGYMDYQDPNGTHTSGWKDKKYNSATNYNLSWGQIMCNLMGVEGFNFSIPGWTTYAWLNSPDNPRGWGNGTIGASNPDNNKDVYTIALGVNDSGSATLGDYTTDVDPNDYNNNNQSTFAGRYATIIQLIQSVNPKAKFFVITAPETGLHNWNEQMKGIASVLTNVFVIDMEPLSGLFASDDFREHYKVSIHLNSMGYTWMAYFIMTYIDWYVRNNYDKFFDVIGV